MAISVRARFEIFKRDEFTCHYCGKKSPDVVLEVDHITPVAGGGTDDPLNLLTSCWDCNRGKSDVPLAKIMTGEDPHDKAIEILEKQRQVDEYNRVIAEEDYRRENATWELLRHWKVEQGERIKDGADFSHNGQEYRALKGILKWCPKEQIRQFMDMALERNATKNLRYVFACARNWRYEHMADKDVPRRRDEE